jgi:hypothetical protein
MVTISKIEIDQETFNEISQIAKDENTTEKQVISDVLKEAIENRTKNEDINDFFELGGKFTADKPFSAVEDIKKMRNGEL